MDIDNPSTWYVLTHCWGYSKVKIADDLLLVNQPSTRNENVSTLWCHVRRYSTEFLSHTGHSFTTTWLSRTFMEEEKSSSHRVELHELVHSSNDEKIPESNCNVARKFWIYVLVEAWLIQVEADGAVDAGTMPCDSVRRWQCSLILLVCIIASCSCCRPWVLSDRWFAIGKSSALV